MSLRTKCARVASHVFSSVNSQTKDEDRRRVGGVQEKNFERTDNKVEEDELPTTVVKSAEKAWKTIVWATYDGDALVMMALRSILRWRTATWWRNKGAWSMKIEPVNVLK